MKIFLQREIREAYAHAAGGGQALHVCESKAFVTASAPLVFRQSTQFAHLFDQDYGRLMATAKRLGVRVIVPQHCGTHRQHVDLCGKPLERAIADANNRAEQAKRAGSRARGAARPGDATAGTRGGVRRQTLIMNQPAIGPLLWMKLGTRERDALIAEKVLNWQPSKQSPDLWKAPGFDKLTSLPSFSTHWACALMLAKAIAEQGEWRITITLEAAPCVVEMQRLKRTEGRDWVTGIGLNGFPEAMCQAALQAAGFSVVMEKP